MTTTTIYSSELESSILWTIINNPDIEFGSLSSEDFYTKENWIILSAINELKSNGESIDAVSIYEHCKTSYWDIIKVPMVVSLMTSHSSVASLKSNISKLKAYTRKRVSKRLWLEISELSEWDPAKLMEFSEKLALASTIGSEWESSVSYDDVNSAYEQITSRFGKSLYGYSWWKDLWFLDEISKGIVKKRVYRIWAPSNTWKTQLIYNIIPELLEQKNEDWSYVKVAFFTLENTKEDTLVSLMCNHSWLNASLVNSWDVEGNWDYLTSLKDRLYIIDDVYEVDKIFSKCISIKPDVVVLDYITHITIQKASWMEKYDTYAERIPKFAKRQNLAWIDLSNLPKNLQTNEEIRATPWFYGSSILMNNCDFAIHLMRNEQFKKTKSAVLENPKSTREDRQYFYSRNCLDLLITKNRWGSVFIDKTYWINFSSWWRWRELTEDDKNILWAKYA